MTEVHDLPHIGVLAIQGDYERHAAALEESGARPSLIKTPEALESLDALIEALRHARVRKGKLAADRFAARGEVLPEAKRDQGRVG